MKATKDMKVGDIYLNPLMQDLWILKKEYIEDLESDNEKWVLALINNDYTEDFEAVADFIKLGNIYDLLVENKQLKSKLEMYENGVYYSSENDKLKEVIEEVRKWLKYKVEALDEFDIPKRKETGAFWFSTRGEIDNLLQILDKVKGE